jgi:hypothetical protein
MEETITDILVNELCALLSGELRHRCGWDADRANL